MTLTKICLCCKTNETNKSEAMCDNCWNYMMPDKDWVGDKLEWGDIWTILCHWHAQHDDDDKNFDFCHDVILVAFNQKWRPTK